MEKRTEEKKTVKWKGTLLWATNARVVRWICTVSESSQSQTKSDTVYGFFVDRHFSCTSACLPIPLYRFISITPCLWPISIQLPNRSVLLGSLAAAFSIQFAIRLVFQMYTHTHMCMCIWRTWRRKIMPHVKYSVVRMENELSVSIMFLLCWVL